MPPLPLPIGVKADSAPFGLVGRHKEAWRSKDPEVCGAGPAGTGKTRTFLEKMHALAEKYPGFQGAVMRKTRESLTNTILVQFERKVLPALSDIRLHDRLQRYRYPNGSFIAVGGLDKTSRIMGGEYDVIYVGEVNELTEGEYEDVSTRLRVGVMPYKQLLSDCNPQSKAHWVYRRMLAGKLTMIHSTHDDNPAVTEDYLKRLDQLTGVRYKRLRLGLWVSAEGAIWDGYDEGLHRRARFPIPRDWPRIYVVDFGFTHPFVWQAWALDPERRMYRYAEVHRPGRIVEDHARVIKEWQARTDDPDPVAIVCDHDAEGRATLERYFGRPTMPATKNVTAGIEAVASRLRGDARGPRLFFLYDSLIEAPDPERLEDRRPICTEDEIGGYVWDPSTGKLLRDQPLKIDDDGCLVAGTPVLTDRGPRPIEEIRVGDRVDTRAGLRTVTAAALTRRAAPVVTATFDDGATLTGTGNHPVWVEGRGWVRLDSLRYDDIILRWAGSRSSGSTVASTSATRTSGRRARAATTSGGWRGSATAVCSTARCGKPPTARFPTVTRSTTPTATSTTTTPATSSASPRPPTASATFPTAGSGARSASRTSSAPAPRRRSGTPAPRDAPGTASTAATSWPSAVPWSGSAPSAGRATPRGRSVPVASARRAARRSGVGTPAWTTSSGPARAAARPSRPTATPRPALARGRVRSVCAEADRRDVYNLTVEDQHEYFAAGVLTHNCDCTRYAAAYYDGVDLETGIPEMDDAAAAVFRNGSFYG